MSARPATLKRERSVSDVASSTGAPPAHKQKPRGRSRENSLVGACLVPNCEGNRVMTPSGPAQFCSKHLSMAQNLDQLPGVKALAEFSLAQIQQQQQQQQQEFAEPPHPPAHTMVTPPPAAAEPARMKMPQPSPQFKGMAMPSPRLVPKPDSLMIPSPNASPGPDMSPTSLAWTRTGSSGPMSPSSREMSKLLLEIRHQDEKQQHQHNHYHPQQQQQQFVMSPFHVGLSAFSPDGSNGDAAAINEQLQSLSLNQRQQQQARVVAQHNMRGIPVPAVAIPTNDVRMATVSARPTAQQQQEQFNHHQTLPVGWKVIERNSARSRYKTYISPDGKQRFRSLAKAQQHVREAEIHNQHHNSKDPRHHPRLMSPIQPQFSNVAARIPTMATVVDDVGAASAVRGQRVDDDGTEKKVGSASGVRMSPQGMTVGQRRLLDLRIHMQDEHKHEGTAGPLAQAPIVGPVGSGNHTVVFTHTACLSHQPYADHLDQKERLLSVLKMLAHPHFDAIEWGSPTSTVPIEELYSSHTQQFVHGFLLLCELVANGTFEYLVMDAPVAETVISPGTKDAVSFAIGTALAAVDAVMARACRNCFCAVRPPGHHASANKAMGFCIFNTVALTAHYAKRQHRLQRIAVVDFDAHHGNGTQTILELDPAFMYVSTHKPSNWPNTGRVSDRGPHRNVHNLAVQDRRSFLALIPTIQLILRKFEPQLIILSAGFDGHHLDSQQHSFGLEHEDYTTLTEALCESADALCDGRIISVLEGGYNLNELPISVACHVAALSRH